jgi:hypothetical protein
MRILVFGVIMGIWKQSVYQCRDGNVQTPFFFWAAIEAGA